MTDKPKQDLDTRKPAPRAAWQRPAVDRYFAGSAEATPGFNVDAGQS